MAYDAEQGHTSIHCSVQPVAHRLSVVLLCFCHHPNQEDSWEMEPETFLLGHDDSAAKEGPSMFGRVFVCLFVCSSSRLNDGFVFMVELCLLTYKSKCADKSGRRGGLSCLREDAISIRMKRELNETRGEFHIFRVV